MSKEKLIEKVLMLLAFSAIGSLLLITIFIFNEGLPIIIKTGVGNFIFGAHWAPTKGHFGILAMILSSIYVTVGAMIFGVPLALACAIVLAEFAPPRLTRFLKPTIELLAGIPSVVYGFLGGRAAGPSYSRIFGRSRTVTSGGGLDSGNYDSSHGDQHFH